MHGTYVDGQKNAAEAFGLTKEAWAGRAGSALVGAGLGFLAAPEGQGLQGAALGAGAGYGVASGVNAAANGVKNLAGGVKNLAASGVDRYRQYQANRALANDPMHQARQNFMAMAKTHGQMAGQEQARRSQWQQNVGQHLDAELAKSLQQKGMPLPQGLAASPQQLAFNFGQKQAEMSFGVAIPKTPFSVGYSSKDVQLPGMHRWVPRDVIEDVHAQLDQGLDPKAIMENEQERGKFLDPLIGAGAGAAAAFMGLPNGGRSGMALGALLGSGLGATYHRMTADGRRMNAAEALHGVLNQRREEGNIRGQQAATATEATPMVVSRGGVGGV